jgi:lipoprotein-releasing system permease protein
VVVALLLSFAATLYPSWRASRLKPAEALRHE